MKKFLVLMGLAAAVVSFSAQGAEVRNSETHTQVIGIQDAYVPGGMMSTQNAFVVVSGMFPNGCYSYDHSEVTDVSATVHEVRVFAKISSGMCFMMMLPFHQEVQLGHLQSGTHTLHFVSFDGTYMEKQFNVQ